MSDFFCLKRYQTTYRREIFAGFTNFLTTAYGFFLVPKLLEHLGFDFTSSVIAGVLVGIIGTLMLALFAKYPFVIAPGVATAVYIAYGMAPREMLSWEVVLSLTFVCGLSLWILNLFRFRVLIIQTIPHAIRTSTTAGLGLFLAVVGLKNGGLLVRTNELFTFGILSTSTAIIVVCSIVITATLIRFRVPGSYFIGILAAWIIGLLFGDAKMTTIIAWPQGLGLSLFKLNLYELLDIRFIAPIISLLFILLFDSTGTVVALSHRCGRVEDEGSQCRIPGVIRVFTCDSVSTMIAGITGISPGTIYLESAAGITAGGRTGLTALTSALCFVVLLFFIPLFGSIPLYATSATLIIIGGSMLGQLVHLPWKDPTEWIPGFFTLILIPWTFNVALGIGVGYLTYILLKLVSLRIRDVHWFSWILGFMFLAWFVVLNPLK